MRIVAVAVAALLLLVGGAVAAHAQQGPMGGPGPGPGMGRGMQQEVTPEQFPAVKARALKMIDERKARLEEHRACIEKAQTHEEMKKCRPEPPMGGGPMRRGGPGPMRQQMPGMQGGQQ